MPYPPLCHPARLQLHTPPLAHGAGARTAAPQLGARGRRAPPALRPLHPQHPGGRPQRARRRASPLAWRALAPRVTPAPSRLGWFLLSRFLSDSLGGQPPEQAQAFLPALALVLSLPPCPQLLGRHGPRCSPPLQTGVPPSGWGLISIPIRFTTPEVPPVHPYFYRNLRTSPRRVAGHGRRTARSPHSLPALSCRSLLKHSRHWCDRRVAHAPTV